MRVLRKDKVEQSYKESIGMKRKGVKKEERARSLTAYNLLNFYSTMSEKQSNFSRQEQEFQKNS